MLEPIQIIKGQAQTFFTVPPLVKPVSAITLPSATVNSQAVGDYEAVDTVTASTVSTTLAAAAAQGDDGFTLTSATGVTTPRFYVAGDNTDDARPELVEAVGLKSTVLGTAQPISRAILNGGVVYGYDVAVALTAAQTATRGRFDVRLSATIGGQVERWFESGYVVDYPIHPPITAAALGQHLPDADRMQYAGDADHQEVIAVAWWDTVVPAIEAGLIDFWSIRDVRKLAPVHAAAINIHLTAHDPRLTPEFRIEAREEFDRRLALALDSVSMWVDDAA